MDMTMESCRGFVEVLSSSAPAPGGGGAAALVGAIGAALGNMVGSLTVGKKKYADVENRVLELQEQLTELQTELLNQVEADEEGFLPLAKAYGIPKDDPNRGAILEKATVDACAVPMRIMELCGNALDCVEEMAHIGSRLAVSDAGCAAVLCKAGMQAASLNVFINTKSMQNRTVAEELNARAEELLTVYGNKADRVFATVLGGLK